MKLNPVLLLFAPLLFSLVSCTKELSRENPVGSSGDSVNFYASIDGVAWKGDSIQQAFVTDSGVLSITGIGRTQDEISIILPAFQKAVFDVNSQTPGYALYASTKESFAAELYLSNASTDASKAGGTVTITEIDTVNKTISGTFQFKLYNVSNTSTKTITAGFFNKIPYSAIGGIINPGGPADGGNTADTLIATVDGNSWKAASIIAASQFGKLIISGTTADGTQAMGLSMPATISPGSYSLNYTGATYQASFVPDPNTFLISQSGGTLKITENDTVNKHVRGTFSFDGVSLTDASTAKITSGYFSCNYD